MKILCAYMHYVLLRGMAGVISRCPAGLKWRISGMVNRLSETPFFSMNRVFQVTRQRLAWRLNPSDYMDRELFWLGEKDSFDLAYIRRNIKKGAVILDVGSNSGYHAIMMARFLDDKCCIHCFEPNPPVYERFVEHVRMNSISSIQLHRLALGDAAKRVPIRTSQHDSGETYLCDDSSGDTSDIAEVISLDEMKIDLRRIDFVKVDIEGYELRFLRGAKTTLRTRLPPMMIEACPYTLARNGHSLNDLMDLLREIGYRRFVVCQGKDVESFSEDSFRDGWKYRNVFCFGPGEEWTTA